MIKNTIFALLLAFFSGCSSGSGSDGQSLEDKNFTTDPLFFSQWYIYKDEEFYAQNLIDDNAHINLIPMLRNYSGKGVKVAIIDDGFDVDHIELHDAIVASYDIATNSSDVRHSNSTHYHGTAVAGIIGARKNGYGIEGIAYDADLILLKHTPNMSDAQTIQLFYKAVQLGADVINCSWGTGNVSLAVKDAIIDISTNAKNGQGIPIIFAVGNSNSYIGNDESSIDEVIAVGSTDKYNLRAWYSNYGESLDIVAPGGYYLGITTLDASSSDGVAIIDEDFLLFDDPNAFIGSSAAAPIVTGVVALLLEKDPSLSARQIEFILQNSADKIGSLVYVDSRNDFYGYGKLNAAKALAVEK